MSSKRRKFTAEQKAEIVRRHLKDKIPVSSLAEEHAIQPTQIHLWVATVLEQAERAFDKANRPGSASRRAAKKFTDLKDQKIKRLEEKLAGKNEVIAELMEENVKAKKAIGDL